MKNLHDYVLCNNNTALYEKSYGYSEDYLFDIYGKTENGMFFHKSFDNPDARILHVCDGIRKEDYRLNDGDFFFRKNNDGSHFFNEYSNYKDFSFSEKEKLDTDYIIAVIKRLIYLKCPKVWTSTSMGGGKKDDVLSDPNWMHGDFILENNKTYTIIKRYGTVKIYEEHHDMYAFDKEEPLCQFELDSNLYKKALRLLELRRFIVFNCFGIIDRKKFTEFLDIEKELNVRIKLK